MEKLLGILEEIKPEIDYNAEIKLIDNGILDSLSILSLVTEIENEYDIEISPMDLIPENFNSAHALMVMINRLKED